MMVENKPAFGFCISSSMEQVYLMAFLPGLPYPPGISYHFQESPQNFLTLLKWFGLESYMRAVCSPDFEPVFLSPPCVPYLSGFDITIAYLWKTEFYGARLVVVVAVGEPFLSWGDGVKKVTLLLGHLLF